MTDLKDATPLELFDGLMFAVEKYAGLDPEFGPGIAAIRAVLSIGQEWPEGTEGRVEYDGMIGTVVGHYRTREGKDGLVLQQIGTKIVHVYGENRVKAFCFF